MSEQIVPHEESGPKTRWSKAFAYSTMMAGGALVLFPWFLTVPEDSPLHLAKVAVGLTGFIVLCFGAYKRP